MCRRFIDSLTPAPRADDKDGGVQATFKARLAEIKQRRTPLYVLVDDCEQVIAQAKRLAGEVATLRDIFEQLLVQMIQSVPMLTLLVTSRENFSCAELDNAVDGVVYDHKLPALASQEGVNMIRESCKFVREAQAQRICDNFHANPLMLGIIIAALKSGHMSVDEAMSIDNLNDLPFANNEMERALNKVEQSLLRSLRGMREEYRRLVLKMAVLLPGPIDADSLSDILAEPNRTVRCMLRYCEQSRLLDQGAGGRDGKYRVNAMLRQAAHKLYLNDTSAAQYHISKAGMLPAWSRYIQFCLRAMATDFHQYKSTPDATYRSIKQNKVNVEHALRSATSDQVVARLSLPELLEMLGYLPYLGMVHDSGTVLAACQHLFDMVSGEQELPDQERATAKALCRTIQSHFMPAKDMAQQEAVLPVVGEVQRLLQDTVDARGQFVLAAALRCKGVVLRDLERYEESAEALWKAKHFAERCGQCSSDQAQLELILCMAELAGTLDFLIQSDATYLTQGEAIASQALDLARKFCGKNAGHPITARCLTTLGYFLKGKGNALDAAIEAAQARALAAKAQGDDEKARLASLEADTAQAQRVGYHEEAVRVNEQAKAIRQQVLGKHHLEVAMCLQQAAISLVALDRFEQAQLNLLESLNIREMNLPDNHQWIFNTHRELAKLYKKWDKEERQHKA